jgi:predicted transcriptional regulator of viral defense system
VPGSAYQRVYEVAANQGGYITTAQAAETEVKQNTLTKMAARGQLERVSWGVYRLVHFPISPLDQYVEATLWPLSVPGVISHESGLALYGLSDANPTRIHLTVPTRFRVQREVPKRLVIHRADLPADDVQLFEGILVTTPERTIRDCHAAHLGPALIRQAIEDGRRSGHLRAAQAEALMRELLKETADSEDK